ncbi:MAG: hypothetical protein H6553_06345 [Chitinophagales bacterium]|nr:hypothetical protein [Chitinophagales bacterium]
MSTSAKIGIVEKDLNTSFTNYINNNFTVEHLSKYTLDTEAFINNIDILFIHNYNSFFNNIIEQSIKSSKHIYIHHFDIHDLQLIHFWLQLSFESQSYVHIGTQPYYYNFYKLLKQHITSPKYIEINNLHNSSDFLICNLMQHDISFVQHIIQADLKNVSVGGLTKVEKNPDIANARLEYNNACTANLTVSKIALHQEYSITIFQKENTIKVDFNKRKIEITSQGNKSTIAINKADEQLQLVENLSHFIVNAKQKSVWYNSLDIYYENLQIALDISHKIERMSGFLISR